MKNEKVIYKKMFNEANIGPQTIRQLKISLEDALTYLGYVKYTEGLSHLEKESIKLQYNIEQFYKKIR